MATLRETLEVAVQGKDELSPELSKLESRLIRFVGAVGAGIAAIKIGAAPIATAVSFEREMANVAKTTDFSSQKLKTLQGDLLSLSTQIDVTADDLAKIAAAAGQQGLGRQGVEGISAFTESVARMSSVLDVTADKAATDIGKILNVFRIPLARVEQAVSIFNEVSNQSTANGEELLDVIKRIGDAAGLLNLKQVAALAATGLDLGLSPEVVGTSFNKIFASLQQKAVEFGRLLQVPTKQWTDQLAQDGVGAFKKVLAEIRNLNVIDQQNTIIKLFGGGRIGSLVNKLVQDTTNSVLDKNLQAAESGAGGLSAIREQATVLNTFKAQATLTLNALQKAAIESSDKILGELTQYIVQLREAVESPSFKSFVELLFSGLSKAVGAAANLASFIAGLNVNWENFLPIVGAFVALKAAEVFGAIARNALSAATSLSTITKYGNSAKTVITAIAGATKEADAAENLRATNSARSRAAELLGYKALYDSIQRVRAAREEAARATEEASARAATAAQAQALATSTGNASRAAIDNVRDRSGEVRQARARVFQAQQAAAQAAADVEQRRNQAITRSQQEFAARSAAIEQEYQNKRAAIAATGTQVGLKAARTERATLLAEEEARLERSLRQIQVYWDRRAVQAAAGARTAIEAERAAYMVAQNRFDAAVTVANDKKSKFGTAAAGAAGAAADAATSAATASALNAALSSQASTAAKVAGIFSNLWLVLRTGVSVMTTVVGGLLRLGGALLPFVGWAVTIYSIADAFGVWDKLGPVFQRLTDWLGITSASSRKLELQKKAEAEAMAEATRKIEAQTEAYRKLAGSTPTSGVRVQAASLASQIGAEGSTTGQRQEALAQLTELLEGAKKVTEQNAAAIEARVGGTLKTIEASAEAANQKLNGLMQAQQAELNAAKSDAERATIQAKYKDQIAATAITFNTLTQQAANYRKEQDAISGGSLRDVENYKALAEATGSLFTPQSLELLNKYGVKLADLEEQRVKIEANAKKAASTTADADTRNAVLDDYQKQLNEVQLATTNATKEIQDRIAELTKTATGKDAQALKDLLSFVQIPKDRLLALLQAANSGVALTGANAGVGAAPNAKGERDFNPKNNGESLARRQARANIKLAQAEAEAERAVIEEGARRLDAANEEAYRRGLVSLEQYYAEREALAQTSINNEIKRRQEDIQAIRAETPSDSAQATQFQADITRYQGEIAVLESRRKTLSQSTARDIANSRKEFDDALRGDINSLQDSGLLPATVIERTNQQFEQLAAQARDRINTLRSNGQGGVADALLGSFKVEAVEKALKPVNDRVNVLNTALGNTRTALQAMAQQGALTGDEYEKSLNGALQNTINKLQQQIVEQEKALDTLKGFENTTAYANLANQIDSARVNIAQLRSEMNATAQSINQSITGSLENTIANFKGRFTDLRDFAVNVLQNIRNVIAKDLAQGAMKALGSLGQGGIGGTITSALGLGGTAAPDGSLANPIYTRDASSSGPEGALNEVVKATEEGNSIFSALPGAIGGFFGQFGTLLTTAITGVSTALGLTSATETATTLSGDALISTQLIVGFSTLSTLLVTANTLLATMVAQGTADSVTGALFHTGGTVGSMTALGSKTVPASVFRNALRYHGGGTIQSLRKGEVPIIAEEGETVRTKEQEADLQAQLRAKKANGVDDGTGGGIVNVYVVTPDQQPQAGPNDVVAVVADNISRGGSIKKLIQQVQMGR